MTHEHNLSENDKMSLMCRLIDGVSKAAKGDTEQSVVTLITRPMWRLWCEIVGDDPDSEPTGWIGIKETRRVFGSQTIVVESDIYSALSFKRRDSDGMV